MTEETRKTHKVLVWDLDETLIIFQTLTTGRFSHIFQGADDSSLSVKLGRRWEKLIIQICDDYFFFEQVEDLNKPSLEEWKRFDDGRDLSTYEFASDGLGETNDATNDQKLAYRHRRISDLYEQGLETLLTAEQLQEWQVLYDLTDSHTDGWLTAGKTILQSCLESGIFEDDGDGSSALGAADVVNFMVSSGSLVPTLVKLLLFKLNKFILHEHVYSSTEVGKFQCFQYVKERFKDPGVQFCAIGDGLDECEAAEALKWPFIKIDPQPNGHLRLPALSVQVIDNYMKVIYGDKECSN